MSKNLWPICDRIVSRQPITNKEWKLCKTLEIPRGLQLRPHERIAASGKLDTPRKQRVAYLVQWISFDVMDQDQSSPFVNGDPN